MTNSFEDLMKMVNIAQSLAAIAARILSERKAFIIYFKIKIGNITIVTCEERRKC